MEGTSPQQKAAMSSLFKEASATESSVLHVKAQLAAARDLKEEHERPVQEHCSVGDCPVPVLWLHKKSRQCGRGGRDADTRSTLSFLSRCSGQWQLRKL